MSNFPTIKRPAYLPAVSESPAADEFLAGVSAGGMPLPVLSVRGKEFRLRKDGEEVNTREREIEVVLVAARSSVSKRYFEKDYEGGETSAPTCSSVDGVTPDADAEVHQSTSCATCPHNMWGSGKNGKGKRCSDYKRLVLLPIIKDQLMSDPAVLDVSPTALRAPKGHRGPELFLREYFNALGRNDLPPQAVVTRLAFTDAEYPQLHFQFSRHAEEAEYLYAMECRDRDDVQQVLEEGQHEAAGSDIPARESPLPKAEAKPKPAARAVPEPEPEPEPEAVEGEVVSAEPAAEPEAAPEESSRDDVLDAVASLLGD